MTHHQGPPVQLSPSIPVSTFPERASSKETPVQSTKPRLKDPPTRPRSDVKDDDGEEDADDKPGDIPDDNPDDSGNTTPEQDIAANLPISPDEDDKGY